MAEDGGGNEEEGKKVKRRTISKKDIVLPRTVVRTIKEKEAPAASQPKPQTRTQRC